MPKRKREYSDDEYESLAKQIKKLERKIKRGRRRRHRNVSDYDSDSPRNRSECDSITVINDNSQPGCSYWQTNDLASLSDEQENIQLPADETQPQVTQNDVIVSETPNISENITPIASTSADRQPMTEIAANISTTQNNPATTQEQTVELDPDLLDILGEDPTSSKEYGKEVQKDIAIRLNHIAISGLTTENRKELKQKYMIPVNCKLIKAPTLNPEIKASLQESQIKRDKGIEYKQQLTSCALSSLAEAITTLLSSEQKNPDLLRLLMDTARTLSDIQYTDSTSRRYFILSTVNKQLRDQLEKTKIDEMLFGNSLAETVKSAKTIISTGAQLRSAATTRSFTNNRGRGSGRPLNYRAPPTNANRRPLPSGGARTSRAAAPAARQTTRSTRQHNSSRSSRQPNSRYRR